MSSVASAGLSTSTACGIDYLVSTSTAPGHRRCPTWRSSATSSGTCRSSTGSARGFDGDLPADCFGILRDKLTKPCLLELIWSYWHEEGMLVQTINAITRRFQNVRGPQDQRSAGQPRDRSAAAAQQPVLGLHPGRAAPAERRAPQLRVRPSLRPAPGRPGGPEPAHGRHAARSSSRPSTTCCTCAPASSSRTTTRP